MNSAQSTYLILFLAILILSSCKAPIAATNSMAQLRLKGLAKDSLIIVDAPILNQSDTISYITSIKARGPAVITCVDKKIDGVHTAKTVYTTLNDLGFIGSYAQEIIGFIYCDYKPVFYKGILLTDLAPKDTIIGMWLDAIPAIITTVIFITSNAQDMAALKTSCKQRKIRFKGHHVTCAPVDSIPNCPQQNGSSTAPVVAAQSNAQL